MRREDGARPEEGGVTCREFWRGWKAAHDVPRIAAEAATAENLFIVKNRRTIISYYVVATLIRLLFITSRQTLRSSFSSLDRSRRQSSSLLMLKHVAALARGEAGSLAWRLRDHNFGGPSRRWELTDHGGALRTVPANFHHTISQHKTFLTSK